MYKSVNYISAECMPLLRGDQGRLVGAKTHILRGPIVQIVFSGVFRISKRGGQIFAGY